MVNVGGGHAMFKTINRYWRVVGTGISFFVFGVGGILLRIIVFPILNMFISEQQLRIRVARNIIQFAFRFFVELMRCLGVLRYAVKDFEKLQRNGLLILANHPTLIDTVFLIAFVKQANCIVKSALWHNPFTRGPVRAAGYICNNNGPDLVNDCIASLQSGNNLIIFPEGTRTSYDGIMKFKRGAANIATRGLHNVTPVIIQCNPLTLSKGERWWQVPPVIPHFSITAREDINVHNFLAKTSNETLAARQLTDYLQCYFTSEIQHHAAT